MKYKLTVNNQSYEVEIENINARPVIVTVDGQRFEVMPEASNQPQDKTEAVSKVEAKPVAQSPLAAANLPGGGNSLSAPLPGTVVELFVKDGDSVAAGQVVLVIEAMKMKNSIRSTRGGTIEKVLVSQGQSVAHKQALVEFAG
ncbi:MAG: biotin/lipoyl-binding protein [Anaerolineales bacterium]|jgi:biotin carboxyl carrier protein|nr:biotin/lipoyl-binding protein [Chloroflexota bacterium]MBK6647541.1 biotin/lipoyl-binding protein [Anaerolineales bacterium]MCC6986841.1 biotin/lipoyl-binding protein [Anaerolineales bacterium]